MESGSDDLVRRDDRIASKLLPPQNRDGKSLERVAVLVIHGAGA